MERQGTLQSRNRNTYDEHCICNLVLADTTAQDDHTRFARLSRKLIQVADVLYNVYNETRVFERVKVEHVSQ